MTWLWRRHPKSDWYNQQIDLFKPYNFCLKHLFEYFFKKRYPSEKTWTPTFFEHLVYQHIFYFIKNEKTECHVNRKFKSFKLIFWRDSFLNISICLRENRPCVQSARAWYCLFVRCMTSTRRLCTHSYITIIHPIIFSIHKSSKQFSCDHKNQACHVEINSGWITA